MEYLEALLHVTDDDFCNPGKSKHIGQDLIVLRTEVLPALLTRIAELEGALQREGDIAFKRSVDC